MNEGSPVAGAGSRPAPRGVRLRGAVALALMLAGIVTLVYCDDPSARASARTAPGRVARDAGARTSIPAPAP